MYTPVKSSFNISEDQWSCKRSPDQGLPRVIIYINFVELESLMLHAKFQDNRTSGSGEVWGAVLLFIPYLWISKIHFWISIIHFWISKNELWISLIILGYP